MEITATHVLEYNFKQEGCIANVTPTGIAKHLRLQEMCCTTAGHAQWKRVKTGNCGLIEEPFS
jgi:hypothetical protein